MTDSHDLGLAHDLAQLDALERRLSTRWGRRKMLTTIGGATAGTLLLAACRDKTDLASGSSTTQRSTTTTSASNSDLLAGDGAITTTAAAASTATTTAPATKSTTDTTAASASGSNASTSCTTIPEETAGPYPGDGSNGPNVLDDNGIVRSDIRSSYGSASGTAQGVLLTVVLNIQKAANCAAYSGAAVYLWHCDRDGNYSLYSSGVTDQNYLRGVQAAGSNGKLTFTSIFPGCYSGRWPHMHFEVFPTLSAAGNVSNKIKTSQLALPKDACDTVYATSGYSASRSNMSRVSLQSDGIFSDGYSQQLATVTGDPTNGYVATLTVNV